MADDGQTFTVVYGMPLCPAGTCSLLAAGDPLLVAGGKLSLKGGVQYIAVEAYLPPLQNGKTINHTYPVADLKFRNLRFPVS